ncbi:hypothetical protein [Nocardia salmonicida]|uniref:hypothetical protein n=1 Tax=Nocardia salmonicida TaxID=53431 RepID=UPI0037A0D123
MDSATRAGRRSASSGTIRGRHATGESVWGIDLAPDYLLADARIPVSGERRLRVTGTVDRGMAYAVTVPCRVR